MNARQTRVAILGGGIAGLTAAFELSATPELRERYHVTVYTMGDRLGGKGASSRNAEQGNRVEEHGLHVWFGFYENAFGLMRRTYAELDPPHRVEDHFVPVREIVLGEEWKGRWILRTFHPASRPGEPGVGEHVVDFWAATETMLAWLADLAERATAPDSITRRLRAAGSTAFSVLRGVPGVIAQGGVGPSRLRRDVALAALAGSRALSASAAALWPQGAALPDAAVTDDVLRRRIGQILAFDRGNVKDVPALAHQLSALRATGARPLGGTRHTPVVGDLLAQYRGWLEETVIEPALDDDDLRYLFYATDTVSAVLQGIVAENLTLTGFSPINDVDLREWLGRNGAHPLTLEHAPFLRGLYDLAFAYEGGDTTRPNLAAGKAVQALIRLTCGYRGALMYRLNDGMDETVFAPLRDVLTARGVQFEMDHEVTNLAVDADQRLVTGIDVAREHDAPDTLAARTDEAEGDFDEVVLAISGGSLAGVCGEVASAVPRFAAMLDALHTVATQSLQVWLTKPIAELGWKFAADAILSSYHEPMATYAAMGHLRAGEKWAGLDCPKDIGYFCGPLIDPEIVPDALTGILDFHNAPADAAGLRQLGDGLTGLLGASFTQLLGGGKPLSELDWNVLFDPIGGVGGERLDRQYWRANTKPSERYVTTPAGSVQHRLAPDDSGIRNLVLAGDWTRNGIDGGCMEAAVVSGRLAARAISGSPETVPGATGWLAEDAWAGGPRYVEYGGLTTIPSPYRCLNAVLHGFWVRADGAKLDALCDRVFSEPSRGRVPIGAVGDHVMLTWGEIPVVGSLDPAFSERGTVEENQVAVWVPVSGPDGVAMFVPYIWLNNPMSLSTGREVVGYPKTWGVPGVAGDNGPFTLSAFGLENWGEHAREALLLEVTANAYATGDPLGSLFDLAWQTLRDLPELDALGEVASEIARGRMRSVFLKQVPAVEGSADAALQQITETTYVIRRFRAWPLLGPFDLRVHPMASQPLEDELGLTSQTLELAYRCEMDFDVRDSRVVWSS
jgi:uncharacterized protein with NAD-binding domain and iron-sulfur cluster